MRISDWSSDVCSSDLGGADLAWIETMSSVDEVKAAVLGAAAAGLPYVVTLSFDTNGRTMMGVTPAQLAELAHALEPRPLAFGGNCGPGASELEIGRASGRGQA